MSVTLPVWEDGRIEQMNCPIPPPRRRRATAAASDGGVALPHSAHSLDAGRMRAARVLKRCCLKMMPAIATRLAHVEELV